MDLCVLVADEVKVVVDDKEEVGVVLEVADTTGVGGASVTMASKIWLMMRADDRRRRRFCAPPWFAFVGLFTNVIPLGTTMLESFPSVRLRRLRAPLMRLFVTV